jgi:excisionase family DNA binding protein
MGAPLEALLPAPSELAALAPAEQRRLLLRVAALLAALGAREPEPQRPAADDTLLTMPQVAKRLGVPESEAYALARQGRLPVIRIGKYVRMRPADLAAFVEAHQDVPSVPRRRQTATERR